MKKQTRLFKGALSLLLALIMVLALCPSQSTATQESIVYKQITSLDNVLPDKEYALVCWRYFGGSDADASNGYLLNSALTGTFRAPTADRYETIQYTQSADGIIPDSALWTLNVSSGSLSIKNVATGKNLAADLSASDTVYYFTVASGTCAGYQNFSIGTSTTSIRYSATGSAFSMYSSAPSSQVITANAANFTIYLKTVEGGSGNDPIGDSYSKLLFFSDYQGTTAPTNIVSFTNTLKNTGADIRLAVCLGDYTDGSVLADGDDTSVAQLPGRVAPIKAALSGAWPDIEYILMQGNHDAKIHVTNGPLHPSGPREYDDCIVYTLNEDEFPWWQGGYGTYSNMEVCRQTVTATSNTLAAYLDGLIAAGNTKPIFLASHVPIHWSARSTNSVSWYVDNIFANILFAVVNEKAKQQEIIYMFGHNHSAPSAGGGYDNDIGGSITFLPKASSLRIPNGTNGTANYTTEKINFTYMNAGYIGTIASGNSPYNINTVSLFTVTDDAVILDRYSTSGRLEAHSYVIEQLDKQDLKELIDEAGLRKTAQEAWDALDPKIPDVPPWAPYGYARMAERLSLAWAVFNKTDATLLDVYTVGVNLREALASMRPGGLAEIEDLPPLTNIIATAKTYNSAIYTQDTLIILQAAITGAEGIAAGVAAGSGSVSLADITDAIKALENAISGLIIDENAPPPIITAILPGTAIMNTSVTFSATITQIPGVPLTYDWSVTPSAGVSISDAAAASPGILFPDAGEYTVAVTVTDHLNHDVSFSRSVTVNTRPAAVYNVGLTSRGTTLQASYRNGTGNSGSLTRPIDGTVDGSAGGRTASNSLNTWNSTSRQFFQLTFADPVTIYAVNVAWLSDGAGTGAPRVRTDGQLNQVKVPTNMASPVPGVTGASSGNTANTVADANWRALALRTRTGASLTQLGSVVTNPSSTVDWNFAGFDPVETKYVLLHLGPGNNNSSNNGIGINQWQCFALEPKNLTENIYITAAPGTLTAADFPAKYNTDLLMVDFSTTTANSRGVIDYSGAQYKDVKGDITLRWTQSQINAALAGQDGATFTVSGTNPTLGYTLNVHITYDVMVTLTAGEGGSIVSGETGRYIPGASVRIAAEPLHGYTFAVWEYTAGELADAESAETVFIVPPVSAVVTAGFSRVPITSLRIDASPTLSVKRGDKLRFTAIVNEDAIDKGVIWSISNKAYATVNPDNTIVILSKTGTVVLTAYDPVSGLSHSIILRIT